jgi:hypothetical protein
VILKVRKILSLSVVLLGTAAAFGQALPTAIRNANLEAGGHFIYMEPDYGYNHMAGIGGEVDLNLRKWYGAEIEGNYNFIHGLSGTKESSYLIGPRIIYVHERWIPYAKLMIGIGDITLPVKESPSGSNITGSYLAYVFGGGVDWRWKRNITVRVADFEYQIWPGFGSTNPIYRPGALTPYQLSAGVKYRFFQ